MVVAAKECSTGIIWPNFLNLPGSAVLLQIIGFRQFEYQLFWQGASCRATALGTMVIKRLLVIGCKSKTAYEMRVLVFAVGWLMC